MITRDNKYPRWFYIIFGIVFIMFVITLIYFTYRANIKNRTYEFNGKVDSVCYDVKGKATVWIKKRSYSLDDNNWDFDHNRIYKGDSIIKEKNSMIIKLVKHDGSVVIEGGN